MHTKDNTHYLTILDVLSKPTHRQLNIPVFNCDAYQTYQILLAPSRHQGQSLLGYLLLPNHNRILSQQNIL